MNKFLTTPIGGLLKHFVFITLSLYLVELQNGTTLFSWNIAMLEKLGTGAVAACLPVVLNWFNPDYKGYGK